MQREGSCPHLLLLLFQSCVTIVTEAIVTGLAAPAVVGVIVVLSCTFAQAVS